MTVDEYLSQFIANQLVHELEPILSVKEVTDNSDLLGTYAEAAIKRLSRRIVYPLHVSSGAVIDYPLPTTLRQLDLIIWAPFPSPGIFQIDDFALVPRSSAFGIMEIKRSNHSGTDVKLEEFLSSSTQLFIEPTSEAGDRRSGAMGLICVLESNPSQRLNNLLETEKVVAIFEKTSTSVKIRHKDVLRLVNFLHYVSWRYRRHSTQPSYPQLKT